MRHANLRRLDVSRRSRQRLALRAALVLPLLAAGLLFTALPAHANGTMPRVIGQSESEAVALLESRGLHVHIVTLAGVPRGRVAAQSPEEGTAVQTGDAVEITVGVRLDIQTVAPRAIGLTEEEAVRRLGEAYFLEIQHVPGPGSLRGRVISQHPEAGTELAYRGVLTLKVVRVHVPVPLLVGRTEDAARQLLDQAGLAMHVHYVPSRFAEQGTVLAQQPREGVRLQPGAEVEVTVAGRRPTDRGSRVRVPDVVGLPMSEAEEQILAQGLLPHVHLVGPDERPAWSVVSQEVPAGRLVAEGSHVGFGVVKPADVAEGIRVPALYGLERDEALDLLRHMGIDTEVRERVSPHRPGTVVGQQPPSGRLVQPGRRLLLTVAAVPPSGWSAPRVRVPDVNGLRAIEAHVRLLEAGFRPRLRRDTGANEPVERVFRQDPRAGVRKRIGEQVLYYLPFRTTMPDLAGTTRTQALQDLQDAGLQGVPQRIGPSIPGGISEVIWQQHGAGRQIARGSLARFRYRMKPAPAPLRAVPDLIGLTREDAKAKLLARGFTAVLRAASFGVGRTRVISQSPVAGALRPVGHRIEVTYEFLGVVHARYVAVDNVVGMNHTAAKQRLEDDGLRVRLVRTGSLHPGILRTQVIAQNPVGGTRIRRGSTVTLTYRHVPLGVGLVTVPNVVGRRADKAVRTLRDAGFSVKTIGIGTRVRSQSPAPGSKRAAGSVVTIKLKF